MKQIPPTELAAWLADPQRKPPLLLDVRESWEYQFCHIDGSTHIPMGVIPMRLNELDRAAEVVVICHHGGRSAQVGMFLERQGFSEVTNLVGGVAAWAFTVDRSMPQY